MKINSLENTTENIANHIERLRFLAKIYEKYDITERILMLENDWNLLLNDLCKLQKEE